jgi:hypothetical protein
MGKYLPGGVVMMDDWDTVVPAGSMYHDYVNHYLVVLLQQ